MTDKIVEILKASEADGFEITDKVTLAYEFYYIGHKLDQNRVRDVEHIDVRVFKKLDDGQMLGSASGEMYPTLTEDEIKKEIDKLIDRAGHVKNPYYELNKPADFDIKEIDISASDIAEDFVRAMKEVPETDTEFINSYEIFVEKNKKRFINSEGIDVTFTYPSSMVEVVINAKDESHEIELYRMYKMGSCDKESLKKEISETLHYGKDRLVTKPTPALGKIATVFPTSDAVSIYRWFAERCNVAYIYSHYSDWEIGKEISDNIKGDKVSIFSPKFLPNSSGNFDVDEEGAMIKDMQIMENDVPRMFWGGQRFRYYLGIKDGHIAVNFDVSGGTKTNDEIRSGKYLEIVEFSDFAVDSITGDIAGEIRLGYLHDENGVTPVSGGSISGSMTDYVKEMYMSKDKRQFNNVMIPALTRLENVTVAGVVS